MGQNKSNNIYPPEDFTGVFVDCFGHENHYLNGKRHRLDGPAYIVKNVDGLPVKPEDTSYWVGGDFCWPSEHPAKVAEYLSKQV